MCPRTGSSLGTFSGYDSESQEKQVVPGGHGASKGVARVPALLSAGVVSAVRALPSKVLAPTTGGGKTSTTGKRRKSRPVPPRPARAPPLSLRPRYPRPRSGRARTTFPISDVADCVRTDVANDSPGEGRFRESLVGGAGTSSVGFSSFGPAPGRRKRAAAAGRGVQEAPRARGQRSGRGARVGEVPPRLVPAVTEPR